MQLEEQDLLTIPDRLIPPQVLVGFVLLDLKFSVYCFVDYCDSVTLNHVMVAIVKFSK
jgi:hypothetical protein